MTPDEHRKWYIEAPIEEVIKTVIWSTVMEGTAWCGWTDRAREGFVKSVQESVQHVFDSRRDLDPSQHDRR